MIALEIETEAEGWTALPGFEALCGRAAEAVLAVACRTRRSSRSPEGKAESAKPNREGDSPAGRSSRDRSATLLLSDDAAVQGLNRDWRGKDAATNVLSFPTPPAAASATGHLGDVVLAWETVRREAERDGKPTRDHALHLVVHGLLHLLGHDHEAEAEAEAMERLEAEALARLGIADPYRALA